MFSFIGRTPPPSLRGGAASYYYFVVTNQSVSKRSVQGCAPS